MIIDPPDNEAERAAAAEAQARWAQARVALMEQSLSWRLTRPLRQARQAIQGRWIALRRSPRLDALRRLRKLAGTSMRPGEGDIQHHVSGEPAPLAWQGDGRRRLLVDVSELARRDARSGIQRVVRNLLAELPAVAADLAVMPVYRDRETYRFAAAFAARLAGAAPSPARDPLVDFRADDLFLGLDLDANICAGAAALIARHRDAGMTTIHVVYDILPMIRPDWFVPGMHAAFEGWLKTLPGMADGLACISRSTAADVRHALRGMPARGHPLRIGHFHLGADLDRDAAQAGEAAEAIDLSALAGARHVFLAVGTIEPRKGYGQLLDAAQALWRDGTDVAFVIAGKRGWLADDIIRRIEGHPRRGERLIWFEQPSDVALQSLYRQATAVVLPSQGEGFGLPLIEAARFGVPIIARDLDVFREIGGAGAFYVTAADGEELARGIARWMDGHAGEGVPLPGGVRPLSWQDSARQLMSFVAQVDADRHAAAARCQAQEK